MALYVTNTLTRRKEPFEPWNPPEVRMYVCGVNLHGPAHVGHARSYLFFDVVRRHLEWTGYRVRHVQNFTDIEDKIIARAQREGRSLDSIAREYIDRFLREMDALHVLRAHHYPRATEAIPDILRIVEGLIRKGHAYVVDGDVYFRVTSDPDYGKLSGRSLEELQAGARVEVDPRKEHPMDFALWKAAKPGEPSWPSPWGPGRPGWHIECSAMSMSYLGEQLDIHGGGEDVIFPHHENEIAQSESLTGKPFVKYWLHNAHLRMEGQEERMTRSLGNVVWIQDALSRYRPDAIRLFLLSSHYRTPMTWREEAVGASERGALHLRAAVEAAESLLRRTRPSGRVSAAGQRLREEVARLRHAFRAALDDDFDTPSAIAHLHALATEVNRLTDAVAKRQPDAGQPEDAAEAVAEARDALRELGGVLGLRLTEPIPDSLAAALRRLVREDDALREVDGEGSPEAILDHVLEVRQRARERRDFATADRIRQKLLDLGVAVEDYPGGSRWRIRDGA
ncbi:MAG: cysteine--tRNA ligase [Armatimonadota bacterium]|nr:cysteine--tRNA ligase [Armatimonadota bacterium]MDW8156729.1 cysteine--tRNA ligase [Armatimonadota bacterium]